jgi:hypothetical protein
MFEGLPIGGRFRSRRLRRSIPRDGTSLQEVQRVIKEALALAEEEADVEGGVKDVDVAEEVEDVDVAEEVESASPRMTVEKKMGQRKD